MSKNVYRFNVGAIECMVTNDGTSGQHKASSLLANAPQDELERALREHNLNGEAIPSFHNILSARTAGRQILFDTGVGAPPSSTEDKLVTNLQAAGIEPEAIDTVVITHCHGDHIGGLIGADGALTYPKAHYIMWKAEWEHWTSDQTLAGMDPKRADMIRGKLLPLKDRLTLIDAESEIAPGVRALPAPGHTPGHMVLLFESGGQGMLHIVDAAHNVIQLQHPDWSPVFDWNTELSPVTRRSLFERAARENLLVMTYHLPFPGVGHIVARGDAFAWQPIKD